MGLQTQLLVSKLAYSKTNLIYVSTKIKQGDIDTTKLD
jgi:hypothetical protein